MQKRHVLRDDQWEKTRDALPGKLEDPGRTSKDNRLFIEAMMWIAQADKGYDAGCMVNEERPWALMLSLRRNQIAACFATMMPTCTESVLSSKESSGKETVSWRCYEIR